MKRGSTIAVVAVSAGILAAASVAGVAVVNASGHSPDPATVITVADDAAVIDTPTVAAPTILPAGELPTVDIPAATPAPKPTPTAEPTPTRTASSAPAPRSTSDEPAAPQTSYGDDDEEAEHGSTSAEDEGHDEHDGDDD